jgi:integrase
VRTLHAHGSKNEWRDRVVTVTEKWTWPHIERHVRALLPTAPLFTITQKAALKAHHEAVNALKLAPTILHDWRHTYAVTLRKRGVPDHLIARQLGHSPRSLLVALRYGAYTPATDEIARAATK